MKVIETFISIQGEGPQSGILTFFVRFSGCNLRCSFCDTKYAYSGGEEKTIGQIVESARKSKAKIVCLTGGEPLIQDDINELAEKFLQNGFKINLETNGSIKLPNWIRDRNVCISMDMKCPSSNMTKFMLYRNLNKLKEKDVVKFILGGEDDYRYAKKITKIIKSAQIYFNPVYSKFDPRELAELIIADRLDNVHMGIQLHKIIWGVKKRGV